MHINQPPRPHIPAFKEKFVAFVDILGFKKIVENSEAGSGIPLTEILELLKNFGSPEQRLKLEPNGPFICPDSQRIENNIDFRLSQISDCAVISTEISPAGAIGLIHSCWTISMAFLRHGILCRGHITRGNIHHSETHFIGTGYQTAYEAESKVSIFQRHSDDKGTPFIEIGKDFSMYIEAFGDNCVKTMFNRMTISSEENSAISPFKRLEHSFLIAGYGINFDANRELKANDNVRKQIQKLIEKVHFFADRSNPTAMLKIDHYISALNQQLKNCDETDVFIRKLTQPFGGINSNKQA